MLSFDEEPALVIAVLLAALKYRSNKVTFTLLAFNKSKQNVLREESHFQRSKSGVT